MLILVVLNLVKNLKKEKEKNKKNKKLMMNLNYRLISIKFNNLIH